MGVRLLLLGVALAVLAAPLCVWADEASDAADAAEAAKEAKAEAESRVVDLDAANWDSMVEGKKWLIKFYAPWCGHCKRMKPMWRRLAAAMLDDDKYQTNVGQIDCDANKALCNKYDVRGYPTVRYLSPRRNLKYDGRRLEPDLMEFSLKMDELPVKPLATPNEWVAIKQSVSAHFVFVGPKDATLYPVYLELAYRFVMHTSLYHFADAPPSELTLPLDGAPQGIVVVTELGIAAYTGEADEEAMAKWIKDSFLGPMPLLTGSLARYLNDHTDLRVLGVGLTYDKADQSGFIASLKMYSLSNRSRGTVQQFAESNTFELGNFITAHLRLKRRNLPAFAVLDISTLDFFLFPGKMSPDTINHDKLEEFLLKVEAGEIETSGGSGFFGKTKRLISRWSDDILFLVYRMMSEAPKLFGLCFAITTVLLGYYFWQQLNDVKPPVLDEDGSVAVPSFRKSKAGEQAYYPGLSDMAEEVKKSK